MLEKKLEKLQKHVQNNNQHNIHDISKYYEILINVLINLGEIENEIINNWDIYKNNNNIFISIKNINNIIWEKEVLVKDFNKVWNHKNTHAEAAWTESEREKVALALCFIKMPKNIKELLKIKENNIKQEKIKQDNNYEIALESIKAHKSKLEKFMAYLAWILLIILGLAFGITTALAILLTFGVAWPFLVLASLAFFISTLANIKIFASSVLACVRDILRNNFLKFYSETKDTFEKLSVIKKAVLLVSGVGCLASGVVWAMITYGFMVTLPTHAHFAFLAVISLALGPVAGVLAATIAILTFALLMRAVIGLINIQDFWGTLKTGFNDCFKPLDNHPNRKIAVMIITGLIVLPLSLFAISMTMYTGTHNAITVFHLIPAIIKKVIGVLGFLAELPFTIRTAFQFGNIVAHVAVPRNKKINSKNAEIKNPVKNTKTSWDKFKDGLAILLGVGNAAANSSTSAPVVSHGAGGVALAVAASGASFFNSLTGFCVDQQVSDKPVYSNNKDKSTFFYNKYSNNNLNNLKDLGEFLINK